MGATFQNGAILNLKLQKQCLNSYWLTLSKNLQSLSDISEKGVISEQIITFWLKISEIMLQFELYNELLIQLLYNEPRMCIRKVNRVKCVQLTSN